MDLRESGEMYLETILELSNKLSNVRSIDISEEMNFSKPSVSRAIKLLRESGYIEVDHDGFITLLPSGRDIAEKIYERHLIFTSLFEALGVDKDIAEQDACRIEHVISDETFSAIKEHLKYYESCEKASGGEPV